jgi:hypothetical protein
MHGCSTETELLVDLRTDLLAPGEVDEIVIELASSSGGPALRTVTLPLVAAQPLDSGVRAAEFADLSPGTFVVRAQRDRGDDAVARVAQEAVLVEGRNAITLLVTRTCMDIDCPALADALAETSCLGGRCVTPACAAAGAPSCGEMECATASECATAPGCASAECVSGVCFQHGCGGAPDGGPLDAATDAAFDGGTDAGLAIPEPLVWYDFELEGGLGAALRDVSGNNVDAHCAPPGCPSETSTAGELDFDGVDDRFTVEPGPIFDVTNELTLVAWVSIPELPMGRQAILCKAVSGPGDTAELVIDVDPVPLVRLMIRAGTTDPFAESAAPFPIGRTFGVAGVVLPDRIVVYVESGAPSESPRPEIALSTDDHPLVVGANHRDSVPPIDNFFRGTISDARIYGVALDRAQIEALFAAGPR